MSAIASQITSLTIAYSTVYPGADQSKHQSSASLAFVWGIHLGPMNSPHKWPVTRKMFLLMTSSWYSFLRRSMPMSHLNVSQDQGGLSLRPSLMTFRTFSSTVPGVCCGRPWIHVDPTVQHHKFSPLVSRFVFPIGVSSSIRLVSCWLDLHVFIESKASYRRSNIGIKIFFNLAATASSWSESVPTIINLNVSVSIVAMFESPTENDDLNPDRVDIINGHRRHNQ